ncbi:MAG: hypothetical protein HQM08_00025 [Candidatus Riflebacteria bacterium]|nr:hypothetical protein [Candidatus Riflebacteria bacterium]
MKKRAFTIIEVAIGSAIFVLLLFAAYRLFFSEIHSIRTSLEQMGINENFRSFYSIFGNDIRDSNIVDIPKPIERKEAQKIPPSPEGIFCSLKKQILDFAIKPPQADFIKKISIDWRLKKASNGTFEVYRDIVSELSSTPGGGGPLQGSRKVCEGVKELYIFSTIKEPPSQSIAPVSVFKPFLTYPPYSNNGTGPGLIHVRILFVKTAKNALQQGETTLTLRTCFAKRGQNNWINP